MDMAYGGWEVIGEGLVGSSTLFFASLLCFILFYSS